VTEETPWISAAKALDGKAVVAVLGRINREQSESKRPFRGGT